MQFSVRGQVRNGVVRTFSTVLSEEHLQIKWFAEKNRQYRVYIYYVLAFQLFFSKPHQHSHKILYF